MLQRHPHLVLGALLFINIIGYVDRSMLLGFSPQITGDLKLSNLQFGLLTGAVWVVSYGVMALVCGSLADRYSRTRIISIGMLIWSACTAASGLAETFGHMVVARVLVASGEAALVPAGTSLIADLFDEHRRRTANGPFFTGIPLGIGLAYLISGTLGTSMGWRASFMILGGLGVVVSLVLWFTRDDLRLQPTGAPESEALGSTVGKMHARTQLRTVLRTFAERPVLAFAMAGFVCVHFAVAGNYFVQLWLVREVGVEQASIARQIGLLQILFGCLGAAGGGWAADWISRHSRRSPAALPIVALLVCLPMMMASRFAAGEEVLLYLGLSASFLLPFSIYGSSIGIFQKAAPVMVRATVMGVAMLSLNIVTMALGTLFAGWLADTLAQAGSATPLKWVLLTFDGLTALALVGYLGAARQFRMPGGPFAGEERSVSKR
jgi:predicted MFS family arabinose efflux permease